MRFEQLARRIILESMQSYKLKELVDLFSKDTSETREESIKDGLRTFFNDLLAKSKILQKYLDAADIKREKSYLVEKAYNDFNFSSKSRKMTNEDYKNLLKFLAKYFADKNLTSDNEKLYNDLYNEFTKNSDDSLYWSSFKFDMHPKKPVLIEKLLREIDASNITDDDVEVLLPDQFAEFDRKMRVNYSYIIGIDDDSSDSNKVSFVVTFDENGNILNKYLSDQTDSIIQNNISFKSLLKLCTRLFAISRDHMSNIKYRENFDDLSDDTIKRRTMQTRKNKLEKLKFERDKEEVVEQTETLFKNINNDLRQYKNVLNSLDITDSSDELSKLYSTFIEELNKSKRLLENLKNIKENYVSTTAKRTYNYTDQYDGEGDPNEAFFSTSTKRQFENTKTELYDQLKVLKFIYLKLLNALQDN